MPSRQHSLQFHSGVIEYPPYLPIPGDGGWAAGRHLPFYMGSTFTNMCDFYSIVHDIVWNYYDCDFTIAPASRAKIDFAQESYFKLLRWADALPLELARAESNAHHIVIAQ